MAPTFLPKNSVGELFSHVLWRIEKVAKSFISLEELGLVDGLREDALRGAPWQLGILLPGTVCSQITGAGMEMIRANFTFSTTDLRCMHRPRVDIRVRKESVQFWPRLIF